MGKVAARGKTDVWDHAKLEIGVMSLHESIHAFLISNPEAIRVAAWRWKGHLDLRRCGSRPCRSAIKP